MKGALDISLNPYNAQRQLPTPLTPYERLCSATNPIQHVISIIHNTLWADQHADAGKTWTQDLQLDLTEESWELIHCHGHKGSTYLFKKKNYKILSRWYRTRSLLCKFDPNTSDRCWRSQQVEGTLPHIWWDCPNIQQF